MLERWLHERSDEAADGIAVLAGDAPLRLHLVYPICVEARAQEVVGSNRVLSRGNDIGMPMKEAGSENEQQPRHGNLTSGGRKIPMTQLRGAVAKLAKY
jgi:hypothetical protein